MLPSVYSNKIPCVETKQHDTQCLQQQDTLRSSAQFTQYHAQLIGFVGTPQSTDKKFVKQIEIIQLALFILLTTAITISASI